MSADAQAMVHALLCQAEQFEENATASDTPFNQLMHETARQLREQARKLDPTL